MKISFVLKYADVIPVYKKRMNVMKTTTDQLLYFQTFQTFMNTSVFEFEKSFIHLSIWFSKKAFYGFLPFLFE